MEGSILRFPIPVSGSTNSQYKSNTSSLSVLQRMSTHQVKCSLMRFRLMTFRKYGKYWSRRVPPMRFAIISSIDMNMKEKRAIALGAARSQLRRLGTPLDHSVAFHSVLEVLD